MDAGKRLISAMFLGAATSFKENSDYLSEIDSRFGDGDHGITIKKIADVLETSVANWTNETIHDFIENVGTAIMGVNGGSAGPLYGTLVGGFAEALEGQQEIDGALLKKMFESCQSEMEDITTAKVGDKTMMDALIPAVKAALAAPNDIAAILTAAATAAEQGAKESEQYVSKFGRAKSYKEQTIGTPDAGAVSTALMFRGFTAAIK